jgi:MarR family 2-MHQ and catechol resistance regulon transcriptional repressor
VRDETVISNIDAAGKRIRHNECGNWYVGVSDNLLSQGDLMSSKLQDEIKQGKPFGSPQEELWLNLARTTAMASHVVEQGLRQYGLSPTQYNVLRILRGAGPQGLCQYEIGDRLVAQVPDVPRIVDRMEKAGWVQRQRGASDRRIVMASLTPTGLELVDSLDRPIVEMSAGLFAGLKDSQVEMLNELLVTARSGAKTE